MESMNRRRFVQVAVVGALPLAMQESRVIGQTDPGDAILEHIRTEAIKIGREFHASPRVAQIRALATNFRLHATYARARGHDQLLQEAAGRLVDREGRRTVLERAQGIEQAEHRQHMLQSLGMAQAETPPTAAVYEQQLNTLLLRGGLADLCEAAAANLDALYARAEKTRASRERVPDAADAAVVPIQLDQGVCMYFQSVCSYLSAMANIICGMAAVQPEIVPLVAACAAILVESGVYCLLAAWYC